MMCPEGHPNPDGSAFCNSCGRSMGIAEEPVSASGPTEPAAPKGRPRAWVLGTFALVGVALAGAGAAVATAVTKDDTQSMAKASDAKSAPAAETMTVSGGISLSGGCGSESNSYYPDIRRGAQVTVFDSEATPIALGTLGKGIDAKGGYGPCIYLFDLEDVPASGSIFSLGIGTRRPYQFTKADSEKLLLSLGD